MAKAQGSTLLEGGDGVSVARAGKSYEVGFLFSSSLVSKMKTVPGAEFIDGKDVWQVPGDQLEALQAAVEDMRDFNRQGGVQVKDFKGGKLVQFDFDKNVARLIGPVDKAKFDREAGGWVVPKESKALVAEVGHASFFDKAINDARGIVIDTAKAYDLIKDIAVKEVSALNLKPGIHHAQADHSYNGKIIGANAFYAAQLTGISNDEKTGFITLHKQVELGNEVFKGDDLRIDYSPSRDVKVRTVEVFKEQQVERETLKAVAQGKIDGAEVQHASTKDGKEYSGRIVDVSKHFALQHLGRDKFVLHDLSRLKGGVTKDAVLDVKYNNDLGVVAGKEQGQSQGVGR